ncbi:hypothetical protein Adt_01480 [Abeliophyllum distichum]|uniref:Uncharacterized protein n=1 Tax=Abeliophyllum distichum TaxID=126358 RepID=A0ABD1VTA3_9LAMI
MRSAAIELVQKHAVKTCRYCSDVQVGPKRAYGEAMPSIQAPDGANIDHHVPPCMRGKFTMCKREFGSIHSRIVFTSWSSGWDKIRWYNVGRFLQCLDLKRKSWMFAGVSL